MIFVCGDVHGEYDIDKLYYLQKLDAHLKLSRKDYLIIAGDFGGIWGRNAPNTDEKLIKRLYEDTFPWTTLWVDGNHENFNKIESYPVTEMFGGRVQKISPHCIHLMRGEVYIIEGKKIFTMGGGLSVDQNHRIPQISWWPQEYPSQAEKNNAIKNLEANNWEVDYVITHTCPLSAMPSLEPLMPPWSPSFDDKKDDELSVWFDAEICPRLKYKRWYFGHFHVDHKFDKYSALFNNVVELGEEKLYSED